jgi:hypothetical protein
MRKVDPEGYPTLGWDLLDWIEWALVHGPGDVQGEEIHLDAELARFVLRCYRVNPPAGHPLHLEHLPEGRRLHDEALLSRVKGRAKSELAGMLVCVEAFAPARWDGWDADGDPVGRPVTYPFVRALATEEDQSSHTYLNAAYMVWAGQERGLEPFLGVDYGRDWQTSTRILLPDGGEIRPSTASSAAKDGGKESFAVYDESHLYVSRDLLRMYRTVKRNLAKRPLAEPWALQTSTMYAKGEASIAEQTHAAAASDSRVLLDHRGARKDGIDLADTETVVRELRWVYGAFADVVDLERILRALRDPLDEEADRRRYFLGEATDVSARFLPAGRWAACEDLDRPLPPDGTPLALGFDGSLRQDASAIRLVTEDGWHFYPPRADGMGPAVWERPDGPAGTGWEVPPEEVEATLEQVHSRWKIVRGYYDPAWWGGFIAVWRGRWGADVVVPWWTNRDGPMARECRAIRTAIVQGELTHDGHPTAARHWGNTFRRLTRVRDEQGRAMATMTKETSTSPNKIDTAIADTLARAARADALAAGLFELEPALPPPDIF